MKTYISTIILAIAFLTAGTNKVSAQVKYIESITETRCAIYSSYKVINESSEVIAEVNVESEVKKAVTSLGPLEYGVLHGCSLLIPRELMIDFGLFREDLKFVQDYKKKTANIQL